VDPIGGNHVIGFLSPHLSSYHSEGLLLLVPLWACGQRSCVVHHVHSLFAEEPSLRRERPGAAGLHSDRASANFGMANHFGGNATEGGGSA
jgi:hypothetical protein